MSDETQNAEDPSIEEILDSIRQIISEDEDEEVKAAPEPEPEPVAEPEPEPEPESEPLDQSAIDDMDFDSAVEDSAEEEVLELTDRVEGANTDSLDIDMVEAEPEPEPEPEPEEPVEEAPPVDAEDALLSDRAESAAYEGVSELVRRTAVEYNGITLEEIVRQELKPLLHDWLDKNLPTIIDRLVSDELERVSKRVLDD